MDKQNQDWMQANLLELEQSFIQLETVGFKIVDIKENGFLLKIKGLYAYISFNYMPWKYSIKNQWEAVAPYLIGKYLYGKIYHFSMDPLEIVLNAEIPQFKTFELKMGEMYHGIVIAVGKSIIWVEFGLHYFWNCGSIIGIISKDNLPNNENVESFEIGQEIFAFYLNFSDKGYHAFTRDYEKIDWLLGNPHKLVGKVLKAVVHHQPEVNNIRLIIEDKYIGVISTLKRNYKKSDRYELIDAKKQLKDGEIIDCEVIGFSEKKKTLSVRWLYDFQNEKKKGKPAMNDEEKSNKHVKTTDYKAFQKTSIEELIDSEAINKLNELKKMYSLTND